MHLFSTSEVVTNEIWGVLCNQFIAPTGIRRENVEMLIPKIAERMNYGPLHGKHDMFIWELKDPIILGNAALVAKVRELQKRRSQVRYS